MSEPLVEINDGKLRGTLLKSYEGEQIYAFLGIPYAKPPTGDLRFKAPRPAEPWDGIRDATEDGSQCYQKAMFTPTYDGSEDCLFLNVFTKNISDNQTVKPVLVFVHGGGFTTGSNNSKMYSPTFLLMEDIVFVTINYRVGILGFLKMDEPSLDIHGNAGFKDQVLALKWIQNNIRKFGGDPHNVTIWGESAGSASISYHLLSPASKGLFHKAILQSGSVLNPWPYLNKHYLDIMKFFKSDCKNDAEILDTLMEVPVHNLVEAQNKLTEEWKLKNEVGSFGACIERPNETAFLTRNPIDIIKSGDYNKVPVIVGYNSNEGLLFYSSVRLQNDQKIRHENFVPQQMNLSEDSDLKKEISEKLKKMYSNDRSNDKFLEPLPPEPWSGIRDATHDGNQCYQKEFLATTYKGSEDCLFLNVFTKNISDNQTLKPVLVFIHGGAFIMGSSDSKMYSPTFLLMEDIVFVTINYRVGILGFLKMGDTSLGVPGNAGLKDQVLALKWIQKNIRKFGGDPSNVTIWGESAGSASVNYHVLSPASKGFFHKAIMQSGTVLNPWPHLRTNCLDIMKFVKEDCKSETEMLDTLMKIPVNDLVEAQNKIAEEWFDDKIRSFGPCVETPNETAFLTRNPIDVITSGEYNKIPMIIGYNSNEGLLMLLDLHKPGKNPQNQNIEYEYYVPQQMNLAADSELKKEICEKFKKVYSNDRPSDKFLMCGDAYFVAGTIGLVENFAKTCTEPIYLQRLNLCTTRNIIKQMLKAEEPGVSHADDLGYFFLSELPLMPDVPIIPGSLEDKAIRRYIKLWGNFLRNGNPTPDKEEFGLTWKAVTKDNLYYLDVDEELSVKTNPDAERMELWREIYKSHENTKNFMA